MRTRLLLATSLAVCAMAACKGTTADETAASVSGDSALQADLALARSDTAAFSEAADVAMANPQQEDRVIEEVIPESAPVTNRVPTTRVSKGDVAMRTSPAAPRPGSASTSASKPASSTPTRPATPPSRDPTLATEGRSSPPAASRPATPGTPAAESSAGTSCASPALADQRRCLLTHLARSDVGLDRNYQAVIATLKREAGTGPRDKEPASVERLRVAQRSWLVYRDTECRRRNRGKEGPLWAPVRAQCLAEFSGERSEELAAALGQLRGW